MLKQKDGLVVENSEDGIEVVVVEWMFYETKVQTHQLKKMTMILTKMKKLYTSKVGSHIKANAKDLNAGKAEDA